MKLAERLLFVFGLACLGWYGLATASAAREQQEARAAVERALAATDRMLPAPPTARGSDAITPKAKARPAAKPALSARAGAVAKAVNRVPVERGVVGLLEIPRLGVSTAVVEGDDSKALRGAAGHLADTPHPWESGNSAIAAHRDGLFRPLRHIRVGDQVRVQTPHGEMVYRVRDTHIVRPTDLSVLEPTAKPTLTLITCYPFYYLGAAPKRFVVHAERID